MGLFELLSLDDVHQRLDGMRAMVNPDDSEVQEAFEEVSELIRMAGDAGVRSEYMVFDPTLARGLNYYTGAIFEVRVPDAPVGSICGGGRYADLTGIFGWEGMSGVGISFGADRIYDVLDHFDAFPASALTQAQVLIVQLDGEGREEGLRALRGLREAGVRSVLYPDIAKLKKQMKYASDLGVQFVLMAGEEERANGTWTVRNMKTGDQVQVPSTALVSWMEAAIIG